jgi:fatty-acyl-CoA synthase
MALPVLDVLDRRSHNLALRFLSNTAAPLSARSKLRLKRHMPDLRIIDGLGSSEAGHLGGRDEATSFVLGDDTVVLSGDRSRELLPGEDDVGWLCTTGRHARGYLDDQVATEATFTTYRGRSLVISGDRVRLRADGTAELLGRDSLVINTGGEKVFSEEVEERLRSIDGVADAVVVGRPHDHWGTEVVAVIQLLPGAELADDELRRAAGEHLAGYKLPRAFVRTSLVRRGPNGKVDYAWARELVGSTS